MGDLLSTPLPYYTGSGGSKTPYLPSDELVEVVNLAIFLERPLLIRGEPGSGKTRLAHAVADELGLPLEQWFVKSTSRARDGLYVYDSVGRLRDAQLAAVNRLDDPGLQRLNDLQSYVQWRPLGTAFLNQQRTVILIDEIDKADIDFPNDLLRELEEQQFTIDETGVTITAQAAPIIFITSNDEKELPDAFLRRCLFYYIEFPTQDRLNAIVMAHFPRANIELIEAATQRFTQLRSAMLSTKGDFGKKVSTSELLDWFRVLQRYPEDEIIHRLKGKLPFPSILLKSWDDHRRYLSSTREDGGSY